MARCELCLDYDDCPFKVPKDIICSEYKQRSLTNADRIRAMSDEELAHILRMTAKGGIIGQRSEIEWINWLKQDTKDD